MIYLYIIAIVQTVLNDVSIHGYRGFIFEVGD